MLRRVFLVICRQRVRVEQGVAVRCMCCSVVHCGAVCCSVLQCVAVMRDNDTHASPVFFIMHRQRVRVVQCVAVCCSVLQCVAV